MGHGLLMFERAALSLRHTKLGRNPLYKWSARHRDLYLTTRNTYNTQTGMTPGDSNPQSEKANRHRPPSQTVQPPVSAKFKDMTIWQRNKKKRNQKQQNLYSLCNITSGKVRGEKWEKVKLKWQGKKLYIKPVFVFQTLKGRKPSVDIRREVKCYRNMWRIFRLDLNRRDDARLAFAKIVANTIYITYSHGAILHISTSNKDNHHVVDEMVMVFITK